MSQESRTQESEIQKLVTRGPMKGPVHFIGVGGIGMRGLAKLCLQSGYQVSASESKWDPVLKQELLLQGMQIVEEDHSLESMGIQSVVYSSAVKIHHPQRQWASERGLLWHRSQCLAHFLHLHNRGVAVAGTHGKTTISSWLSHILFHELQAGFCVGGIVTGLNTTAEIGSADLFVIEADESDGSMVNFKPSHLIISNLEPDHLDYWKDPQILYRAMSDFAKSSPHLVLCRDDPMLRSWNLPAIYYGFDELSDLRITSFASDERGSQVGLAWKGGSLGLFPIALWGRHNALNLAAVVAMCLLLGVNLERLRLLAGSFLGAKRRLEMLGDRFQVRWCDDYAHHPSEIQATLGAIRSAVGQEKVRVIFQPHRATRLRDFFDQFAQSFEQSDELWLVPVYLAGEEPILGIDSCSLFQAITQRYPDLSIQLFDSLEAAKNEARENFHCRFCVTMGAGDITKLGRELMNTPTI